MNQQSNDNFDRLFRKAANKYPLKTNNKNWDVVAAKLNELKLTAKKKNNRKWQLAILLLLITAGGFGVYSLYNQQSQANAITKNTNEKNSANTVKKQHKFLVEKEKNSQKPDNKSSQQIFVINQKNNNTYNVSIDNNELEKANKNLLNNNFEEELNSISKNKVKFENFQLAEILSEKTFKNPGIVSNFLNQNAESFVFEKNENVEANKLNEQSKPRHVKLSNRPATFLYGSFFMSPDFSTIKFQHINKPGFKVGVQLGYRINNNLSAEINLVRYHSQLYSAGKYFSTSNIKLKPNTIIDKLYGKSKTTEIPVALRYNIPKTSNHFFVTAGTTVASLIHTERYTYDVTRNGTPSVISKHFYSQTGTKYFSDINLSAGYQAPVLHSLNIKIEPYYQIPVKSFGIGNLPVTHVGVNIGIVKDLK